MRRNTLGSQIALRFAGIVLVMAVVISVAANVLISHQFEEYVREEQKHFVASVAQEMSWLYDAKAGKWNIDYIHGAGMHAMRDGYLITVRDAEGNVIWEALNHDMGACNQVMDEVTRRMKTERPLLDGHFATDSYELMQGETQVGWLMVNYYGPYSLNENDFHFLTSLNQILAVVGGIALIGALAAAFHTARGLSRPLKKTVAVIQRIADGDYDCATEAEETSLELAQLSESICRMARNLKNQETLRRQLTTDVAHELKTPLAVVSSHLEAMEEGIWEPTKERLKSCGEEMERLNRLVKDLQRLNQMEADSLILQRENVDLYAFAQELLHHFSGQMHQAQLTARVEGESCLVFADRERLWQAFSNLMANAIKYSNSGGELLIRVEQTDTQATCSIKDTGIGIAPEDLPFIFERFYRADKSHCKKSGGSGIGLAIAKAIVLAHEGRIWVTSEVGVGSVFGVDLPAVSRYGVCGTQKA